MKKIFLGSILSIALLGVFGFTKREALAVGWIAHQTEKQSLEKLQALIVPSIEVRRPEMGEGPFPVILQFHGCGGFNIRNQGEYADMATDAGYIAVMVQSNAPRGIDGPTARETVCRGKALLGQERAGDILAALDYVLKTENVDLERVLLAGWSHGAWSIMDYLSMDIPRTLPPSLSTYGGQVPAIRGAVLFYPYCGFGSRTRIYGWQQVPDVLALIAGADTIVPHEECLKDFVRLSGRQGVSIDQTVYADTEHAFDGRYIRPELAHWHHAENAADAKARYRAFLAKHNPPSSAF